MNHDVGGWTHLGPGSLAHAQPWKTSSVRSATNGEFLSFLDQDSQLHPLSGAQQGRGAGAVILKAVRPFGPCKAELRRDRGWEGRWSDRLWETIP